MLDAALAYHAAGWWVVPQAGKKAVCAGWDQFRLNEQDLREYLAGGRLNIAVALHQSACIDVECDSPEAEAALQDACPDLPPTPTWRTRRGLHRLFLRPEKVPDKAKVEVNGIEFRLGAGGHGALSTVPPSVHPDTGQRYEWLSGLSVFDVGPAPLPAPLAKLLAKVPKKAKAGEGEPEPDADIPDGRRHDELLACGNRIMRSPGGEGIITDYLHGVNKRRCKPPLPDAEVDDIAADCKAYADRAKTNILPQRCASWNEVRDAWADALEWRQGLEDVLAVMLAVAASTSQGGKNQLFFQIVGNPGSGKTELCNGLLVSPKCKRVERLNGIFSGMKDFDDPDKDYSFLGRANHMTWVTPEMDLLMSSPGYDELMSQMRRVFDGAASATYKNRDHDLEYSGLRTPWVQAGTQAMVDRRQTSLGDRFLRMYIDDPDAATKRRILHKVGLTELDAMMVESNCSPESGVPPRLLRAYQLTGGYVDWLRANATPCLRAVRHDPDHLLRWCTARAEFVAHMRSGPPGLQYGREPDYEPVKEMPSRLQGQFVRLAMCLAVALQRGAVDDDILRVVKRVALDTAHGRTLNIARQLYRAGANGHEPEAVAAALREDDKVIRRWFVHMEKVGTAASWCPAANGVQYLRRWRLSDRFLETYREVIGAQPQFTGRG